MDGDAALRRLVPYVPRLTLEWLRDEPQVRHRQLDGSVVFADISGFTALSERLASLGREGAEHLTDVIDATFQHLLEGVYREGGRLVFFGGDAVLLLFDGDDHARRAVRAAVALRRDLRAVARHRTPRGSVTLRISQGVHTGVFDAYLVGSGHRQLMLAGPGISAVVAAEHEANAGQIVMSPQTAAEVPSGCSGEAREFGVLVARSPGGAADPSWYAMHSAPLDETLLASAERAVPVSLRSHVIDGNQLPEHRICAVGFLQVLGLDEQRIGKPGFVDDLGAVVEVVEKACERLGVTFLAADADAGAAKIILVAGAPRTAGQDEERMLLALRDILDASPPLRLRAGVHRGSLYVGDVGPAYRRTYTVMGDVVNTAARLMARADPGTILATHDVADRTRVSFELTQVEPFVAKGKRDLVHAVEVGARSRARPAERGAQRVLGREREQETLLTAWTRAREGAGGAVEIVGEPGLGKSTLIAAHVHDVTEQGASVVPVQAELYGLTTPYGLACSLLEEVLGLAEDAAPADVRSAISSVVAQDERTSHWLPVLSDLFPEAWGAEPHVEALTTEARAARRREVFVAVLKSTCADPTVFVVEDTHWVDEASSDLLQGVVDAAADSAWQLLFTRRPVSGGFTLPDASGERVVLTTLDESTARALVRDVLGRDVPPADMQRLVDLAQGNPLFLLELARALRTASDVDELPDSLESLLALRLDTVGPRDLDLLRRMAVLGIAFDQDDIDLVSDEQTSIPGPSTWLRLDEFVQPADDGRVAFSHAMIRDAAYGALPFRLRRELHGRVAQAWEHDASREPALLSTHYFAAGRWLDAWRTSRQAGEDALRAHAPVEAVVLLRRAVHSVRNLGDEVPAADRSAVNRRLAVASEACGSFDAADRAFREARRSAADPMDRAQVLIDHAWLAERQGRLSVGVRRGRQAQRTLSATLPDARRDLLLARALTVEGTCRAVAGDHGRAVSALGEAMRIAERAGDEIAWANAASVYDWSLVMTGASDVGENLRRALEIYERRDEPEGQAQCLTNLGILAYWRGDWTEAVRSYRAGEAAYRRIGDVTSAALGAANVAEVLSDQGHWEAALSTLDEALDAWHATGHRHGLAWALGLRGRALARLGRPDADEQLVAAEALHRDVGSRTEADQVAVWRAEAALLSGRLQDALTLLESAGADSPTGARVRGTAHLLGGGDADQLRRALRIATDDSDSYEVVCTTDALQQLGCPVTPEESDRAAQLAASMGIVSLALMPSS